MKKLVHERKLAEDLRRKGLSYKEIIAKVPVAKSTLSSWLKPMPLSQYEKKVLRKRVYSNISKGRAKAAATNRKNRLQREKIVFDAAKREYDKYASEPLFATGVALYWAEGAKRQSMFHFMNSDEKMIETMLCWLEKYNNLYRKDLYFRLFLHLPYKDENWEQWWAKELGVPLSNFKKTIIKPSGLGVKKRPSYKGCLRVEVPKSKSLLFKTKVWIKMMVDDYKKR